MAKHVLPRLASPGSKYVGSILGFGGPDEFAVGIVARSNSISGLDRFAGTQANLVVGVAAFDFLRAFKR